MATILRRRPGLEFQSLNIFQCYPNLEYQLCVSFIRTIFDSLRGISAACSVCLFHERYVPVYAYPWQQHLIQALCALHAVLARYSPT
jgi:hypothetical protein